MDKSYALVNPCPFHGSYDGDTCSWCHVEGKPQPTVRDLYDIIDGLAGGRTSFAFDVVELLTKRNFDYRPVTNSGGVSCTHGSFDWEECGDCALDAAISAIKREFMVGDWNV